ncbi:MAG: hypothetical protein K2K63_10265 [Acetatifactor sp.]|nr:hypothetical protein [Acetatifactor sp.]
MQNHEQSKEEMIELLTTVSEVIWSGGLLLLDMMHRGYLDELLTEDDEEYNKKVEILKRHKDLLTGDLFGELTFIVITAGQNIEKLIGLVSAKEDDSNVGLIKEAFVMYSNHYRPWEVRFSLEKIIGQNVSIEKIFLTYLKENERYTDCLNRYSEEGHCGG